jgi:uncharacterized protein YcfL
VQIASSNSVPLIAAERLIYKVGGVNVSFTEMMGLPDSELDDVYWLPWYNNNGRDLDTQLRFGNVSGNPATVHVYIGDGEASGCTSLPAQAYPYVLDPGESVRVSCPGVNDGPVRIESTQNIVAAERLIYKVGNVATSFTEMMALPEKQLDNVYWLPWYNNVGLDTQLRIANATNVDTTVTVTIGTTEMPSFDLPAGTSTRVSYEGVNDGPVKIESDANVNIVAAERLIYKVGSTATSFTETMALPENKLNTVHWLPWYNHNGNDLDTQLRIANTTALDADVQVWIGGTQIDSFPVGAGKTVTRSYPGTNDGPVQIVSDQDIVVSERLIYKANNAPTSFSEIVGLPAPLLNSTFWFPWYNNNGVDLDTQLRFGVP